jgi:hypothetical protein
VSCSHAGQPPAAAAAAAAVDSSKRPPATEPTTEAAPGSPDPSADVDSPEQLDPETPTAALPRVHTPGRAAAEVAAELTTPQLAHSAAAVMTVSEAWRDETSSTQSR